MTKEQSSKYWMESEGERKRLASNHLIAKDAMGGTLVRAPVDFSGPLAILDSGTADGTWLLDLASSLPSPAAGNHSFVGTDLNAVPFPTLAPSNVSFAVQDIRKPGPESQKNKFDLVHQRLTLLGAGSNPSASISHLYDIIKPGGWIQISEGTMDFPSGLVNEDRTPAYQDMLKLMKSVAGAVGAEWHLGGLLGGLLDEAGFTEVEEEEVMLNMGCTNKDGQLASEGAKSCGLAVQGLAKFMKSLSNEQQPLSNERYRTLSADLEQELLEKGAVYPLKVAWGRKPR